MVRDFTGGKKPARSTSVSLHDSVQKSRESNGNPAHKRQKLVVSTGGGTIVIDPMPMRMQKATQGMLAMRMQRATRFAVRVPAAWLRKPSWLTDRLQDPPLPRLPSAYKKTIGWLALCTSGLMSLASTYHLRASGTKAKQRTRTTRTYGPHQADRRRLQRCSCVHRWPAAWVDTPIVNRAENFFDAAGYMYLLETDWDTPEAV